MNFTCKKKIFTFFFYDKKSDSFVEAKHGATLKILTLLNLTIITRSNNNNNNIKIYKHRIWKVRDFVAHSITKGLFAPSGDTSRATYWQQIKS